MAYFLMFCNSVLSFYFILGARQREHISNSIVRGNITSFAAYIYERTDAIANKMFIFAACCILVFMSAKILNLPADLISFVMMLAAAAAIGAMGIKWFTKPEKFRRSLLTSNDMKMATIIMLLSFIGPLYLYAFQMMNGMPVYDNAILNSSLKEIFLSYGIELNYSLPSSLIVSSVFGFFSAMLFLTPILVVYLVMTLLGLSVVVPFVCLFALIKFVNFVSSILQITENDVGMDQKLKYVFVVCMIANFAYVLFN